MRSTRLVNKDKQDGFTLIEVIVAVVIIAILASVITVVWTSQQRAGLHASVKSDLKNTATELQTFATRNEGKFPQFLPSNVNFSEGNIIKLEQDYSNYYGYCLSGFNEADPATVYYYSSYGGGLLKEGQDCGSASNYVANGTTMTINGATTTVPIINGVTGNWSSIKKTLLSNSRVLIYSHPDHPLNATQLDAVLRNYGFMQLDYTTTLSSFTDAALDTYDLIVVLFQYWGHSLNGPLLDYYQRGGNIIADGNDFNGADFVYTADTLPWSKDQTGSVGVGFQPTYNTGLTPPFPYTFRRDAWYSTDSSQTCITNLKPGVVALALWPHTNAVDAAACVTMFGAVSPAGGKLLKYHFVPLDKFNSPYFKAGLDWITTP